MTRLQTFIYPSQSHFGQESKYLRGQGYSNDQGTLNLATFGQVSFDTFYNAFSIPLWSDKVGLDTAQLQISGRGTVQIDLCQYYNYLVEPWKSVPTEIITKSIQVDLSEDLQSIFSIQLSDYSGLVYPRIKATTPSQIETLVWETEDAPRRMVKMGISITHFDRKAYVLPAITRIKENFLDQANWQDKIKFLVVDNSQNITQAEAQGVTIIPNQNTGGTGGFMRGLEYYRTQTDATHVLFMDDDASLEPESISRTYAILQFALADNAAVGASLFYEEVPDLFIERGAMLTSMGTRVLFNGTSALPAKNVLKTEESPIPETAYIGWWHCAFPIEYAKNEVPPLFVRMDDAYFTQINDFHIIYGNGIAAYAENFSSKVTPLNVYLDVRNNLIVNALAYNNVRPMLIFYGFMYLRVLLSLRYGSVALTRLALKDFLQLTAEKLENEDIGRRIPEFKALMQDEIPQPINLEDYRGLLIDGDKKSKGLLSEIWRLLTVNKIFLPLKKGTVVYQDYYFMAYLRSIAGYKQVLYYNRKLQTGFLTKVQRGRVLKSIFGLTWDLIRLIFTFNRVGKRLKREDIR